MQPGGQASDLRRHRRSRRDCPRCPGPGRPPANEVTELESGIVERRRPEGPGRHFCGAQRPSPPPGERLQEVPRCSIRRQTGHVPENPPTHTHTRNPARQRTDPAGRTQPSSSVPGLRSPTSRRRRSKRAQPVARALGKLPRAQRAAPRGMSRWERRLPARSRSFQFRRNMANSIITFLLPPLFLLIRARATGCARSKRADPCCFTE